MLIISLLLFLLNLIIFFKISKLSKILNIYDAPDNKLKLHKKNVPIIGGIILAFNFSILFFYQIFFLNDFISIDLNKLNFVEVVTSLLFIFGFFVLGLCDDKINLSPNKKLFYSIILILLAIFLNENLAVKMMSISFIENKIFFENYSIFFTIFCFLILVNALNFYDGINGQSCLIFIISFSYLLIKSNMHYFYIISIILILFIFFLNISNKIFLGDSGIYLLSIILSSSLIYEHNIQKNIIFADEIFFLLLLPGFDLLRLTLKRLLNLKNPFFGDRDHIHHLLINKYSLKVSNSILFLTSITPIILFSFFNLNFFLVFFIFLSIYVFLIKYLKSND
tara:strand:- start:2368 stop:3378 length:1011 start_codon:yes stop_codon:yes gene_type:complete